MTSPLQDRTYLRLFTAQVVALAGTGLSTVALALLAYDLAGGDAGPRLRGAGLVDGLAGWCNARRPGGDSGYATASWLSR